MSTDQNDWVVRSIEEAFETRRLGGATSSPSTRFTAELTCNKKDAARAFADFRQFWSCLMANHRVASIQARFAPGPEIRSAGNLGQRCVFLEFDCTEIEARTGALEEFRDFKLYLTETFPDGEASCWRHDRLNGGERDVSGEKSRSDGVNVIELVSVNDGALSGVWVSRDRNGEQRIRARNRLTGDVSTLCSAEEVANGTASDRVK